MSGDRGILGLRRNNQPQQNQQNQCNRADGSCGTATMERSHVRQEVASKARPAQMMGSCGTTTTSSSQVYASSCGVPAKPVDTSKAQAIGNGMRAQTNSNGSITVTIPLTTNDLTTGSKLDYSYKRENDGAPRQQAGNTKNLVDYGGTNSDFQMVVVRNGISGQAELQVTLRDSKTTGQVWIGDRQYAFEPSKIKAEMARNVSKEPSKVTSPAPETKKGSESAPETKKKESPEAEVKKSEVATSDKLSELKAGIKAALAKASEATATAEEKAVKKGLTDLLKTLEMIEKKLADTEKKLETRLKNPNTTEEQKKEISSRIEKIREARSEGVANAFVDLSNDPKTVNAKLVEQFKPLWTEPKSEKAKETELPKKEEKKLDKSTDTGVKIDRGPTDNLDIILAPAREQMKIFQEQGLSGRDVKNIERIIKEVEVVKQALLEERAKLTEKIGSSTDPAAKARIEKIDSLLDVEIPTYLGEGLYRKPSGPNLPKHTFLDTLAEITNKQIRIQDKFKDDLKMPTAAALDKEQTISVEQAKEIDVKRGQSVRILNSKGEVVAEVQRDEYNKLSQTVANGTAKEQFAGLEVTPEGKVLIKGLTNPTEKTAYTLERRDYLNDTVISKESFSIVPKPGATVTPEVAKEKEELEAVFKTLSDVEQRKDLVGKRGFSPRGDEWVKPSTSNPSQLIVVKDLGGAATVTIEAVAPVTPASAPAAGVAKETEEMSAAFAVLSDVEDRREFVVKQGYSLRGGDWVKPSAADPSQLIVVKDIAGTVSVAVEAATPPATAPATSAAQEQLTKLQATLAKLSPGMAKDMLEVADYKLEGTNLVKRSLDPNYNLVVDKDFKASLVPVVAPSAPEAAKPVTPSTAPSTSAAPTPEKVKELAKQLLQYLELKPVEAPGWFSPKVTYRLEEGAAMRANQVLENARVGGYMDELAKEAFAQEKDLGGLAPSISSFDDILRETYLVLWKDSVGKDQAEGLRNSRFGNAAVSLAEKISEAKGYITNDASNDVLPFVRRFVEGDPKKWKDLEQAYEFVSYDKTPLRKVLDKFDYNGWDGYVRGQDMNAVDALLGTTKSPSDASINIPTWPRKGE